MVQIPHANPAPVKVLSTVQDLDGRWFAFASDGDAVRRWAIGPGGPPDVVYRPQARFDTVMAVAAVGRQLLAGGNLGQVWRWDLATGDPFGEPIRSKDRWNRIAMGDTLAILELDGRPTIVTGGHHLRCWDLRTGDEVGERWRADTPEEQVRVILAATVLPDGTPVVLSGGFDGVVRRWDPRTGTELAAPMRDCGRVFNLVPVRWPDGRAVVCVLTRYGVVHRRDIITGEPVAAPIRAARDPSTRRGVRVHLATVGGLAATCADGATVQTWDLVTGEAGPVLVRPTTEWVTALAAAEFPDGSPVVVVGTADGTVRYYDAKAGTPVGDVDYPHGASVDEIRPVHLPDGRTVLAVDTGRLKCFDAATGDLISTSDYALDSRAVPAYLPDGRVLLLKPQDDGIIRWDFLHAEDLPRLGDPRVLVHDVIAVSQAGMPTLAIGACDDGTVRRWDAATGEPISTTRCDATVLATATGPGGLPLLITGDTDGTVAVWDAVTGEPFAHAQVPDTGGIADLAVLTLADGRQAVIATGLDGVLLRWWNTDLDHADRAETDPSTRIIAAQVDPSGVPVVYLWPSDYDRSTPVQRWRLDTLTRVDTLPSTVRAVYDTTTVHSKPDGSLHTEPLPPLTAP